MLTLERKDNSKNYEPGNCVWRSRQYQNRNRRDNHRYMFNGEALTLAEWAERTGIKRLTLYMRINKYGWSVEKALTTPV